MGTSWRKYCSLLDGLTYIKMRDTSFLTFPTAQGRELGSDLGARKQCTNSTLTAMRNPNRFTTDMNYMEK